MSFFSPHEVFVKPQFQLQNDFYYKPSFTLLPQLKPMVLPSTWMKEFFLAHIYTELQLIEEALQKYQNLIDAGFSKSTYIISQIAVAYHNVRGE